MAVENTVGVDSMLEMYTTVLAWQQYGVLWNLLNDTGLVFLPFLGMLFKNVLTPLQSQQARGAADVSLRRLEIDVLSALVVILLAGQPLINLRPQELAMPKLCNIGTSSTKFELVYEDFDKETLYKKAAFIGPSEVAKVPVWWYGVMAISSGVTQAAKVSMPCIGDMLASNYYLKVSHIKEPLRSEIVEFVRQCYYPTINFIRIELESFGKEAVDGYNELLNEQAEEYKRRLLNTKHWKPDAATATTWSRTIMESVNSPMFNDDDFRRLYADRTVQFKSGEAGAPFTASCRDWWLTGLPDGRPSIDKRLRDLFNVPEVFNSVIGSVSEDKTADISPDEKELLLDRFIAQQIQLNLNKKVRNLATTIADFPDSQFKSELVSATTKSVGFVAAWLKKWAQYPMTTVVTNAAPMAQAALVMTVYILLPLGLVISSYSIQFLIVGAIGVFSVKFLGYLIYIAHWLQNMILQVAEHGSVQIGSDIRSILELTMMNSYFLFPAIYFGVMGWAGVQLGAGFQGAFDKLAGQQSSAIQASTRFSEALKGQIVEQAAQHLLSRKALKAIGPILDRMTRFPPGVKNAASELVSAFKSGRGR